jgi:hypothetical protein
MRRVLQIPALDHSIMKSMASNRRLRPLLLQQERGLDNTLFQYICALESQYTINDPSVAVEAPGPRSQPKISLSLTTFKALTQPPKTC